MRATVFNVVRFPGFLANPCILLQGNPATTPAPRPPHLLYWDPPQGRSGHWGPRGTSLAPDDSTSQPTTTVHRQEPNTTPKKRKKEPKKREEKKEKTKKMVTLKLWGSGAAPPGFSLPKGGF